MNFSFVTGSILAVGLGVTSVQASTIVTFEDDEAGFVEIDDNGDGRPNGPFFVDGLPSFTIEADTFERDGSTITLNGEREILINQNGEGLGIDNQNGAISDNPDIDGFGSNDILLFSFSSAVTLSTIAFENVTGNDDFVFYLPSATTQAEQFDIGAPALFDAIRGDEGSFAFLDGLEVFSFGIGASESNDDFRLSKIEFADSIAVAPVPLPAAGWMLMAGLGGLVSMRRRNKRA